MYRTTPHAHRPCGRRHRDSDEVVHVLVEDIVSDPGTRVIRLSACTSSNGESYFVAGFLLFKPSASKVLRRRLPALQTQRLSCSRRVLAEPVEWPRARVAATCGDRPDLPTTSATPAITAPSTDGSCSPAARMFPNASDPLYKCMLAHHGHFSHMVISKACATKLGDQSIHKFLFLAAAGTRCPDRSA